MAERVVDAVVFDVGNVLIEWDPRHLYRRIFTHDDATSDEAKINWFLDEVCPPEWNLEQDRGRTIAEAEAEAIARHPDMAAAIRSFYGRFQVMIPRAIEGSVAVLHSLKAAGVPVHGLTNFSAETFPSTRDRFDFLNTFEVVVVSGEEGVIKPDPDIFHRLIDRAGLVPERTAFVDDSPANIAAATSFGFQAHRFVEPAAFRDWVAGLGLPVPA